LRSDTSVREAISWRDLAHIGMDVALAAILAAAAILILYPITLAAAVVKGALSFVGMRSPHTPYRAPQKSPVRAPVYRPKPS
jgi:hypothetical protein